MPRLMSFSLTTDQIRARTKTVTRRMGWKSLKVGDLVWAVEKAMGLKKGEKAVRLALLRVTNVLCEPLQRMLWSDAYGQSEVVKEGFPEMSPEAFVAMFCRTHRGCTPETVVTRIAFVYEDAEPSASVDLDELALGELVGGSQPSGAHVENSPFADGGHAGRLERVVGVEGRKAPRSRDAKLALHTLSDGVGLAHRHEPSADHVVVGVPAGAALDNLLPLAAHRVFVDVADLGAGVAAHQGEQQRERKTAHREQSVGGRNLRQRPLFRYLGGKARLASWIVQHLPPHDVYTESYGGAASVLMAKPRAAVEVYNDLFGRAVNLMRVVREQGETLADAVALTPYSRREYETAFEVSYDPFEDARRFLVRSWMGIGVNALSKPSGFRAYLGKDKRVADEWTRMPDIVRTVAARLQGVILEEREAVDVLRAADGPRTCHYVDPPYGHQTRGVNRYAVEIDESGHERLLETLVQLRGAVVLSGYDTPLYREALGAWTRVETLARAQDNTLRRECLWLNARAMPAQIALFPTPIPSPE